MKEWYCVRPEIVLNIAVSKVKNKLYTLRVCSDVFKRSLVSRAEVIHQHESYRFFFKTETCRY